MTLLLVACVLVCVACLALAYGYKELRKEAVDQSDRIAHLALELAQLKAAEEISKARLEQYKGMLDLLSEKVKAVEDKPSEEMEKFIEKKWEDAIQRISDFDPFAEVDNK